MGFFDSLKRALFGGAPSTADEVGTAVGQAVGTAAKVVLDAEVGRGFDALVKQVQKQDKIPPIERAALVSAVESLRASVKAVYGVPSAQ